jgi:hypothetical protein
MRKKLFAMVCSLVFCFPVVSSSVEEIQEALTVPLGIIELKPPEQTVPVNSLVRFPHSRHFMYECRKCHHKWEGSVSNLSCGTSNCHDLSVIPKADGDKSKQNQSFRYFKKAYHDQCIGCHKAIKVSNFNKEISKKAIKSKMPNPGPTGCIECHPRRN